MYYKGLKNTLKLFTITFLVVFTSMNLMGSYYNQNENEEGMTVEEQKGSRLLDYNHLFFLYSKYKCEGTHQTTFSQNYIKEKEKQEELRIKQEKERMLEEEREKQRREVVSEHKHTKSCSNCKNPLDANDDDKVAILSGAGIELGVYFNASQDIVDNWQATMIGYPGDNLFIGAHRHQKFANILKWKDKVFTLSLKDYSVKYQVSYFADGYTDGSNIYYSSGEQVYLHENQLVFFSCVDWESDNLVLAFANRVE